MESKAVFFFSWLICPFLQDNDGPDMEKCLDIMDETICRVVEEMSLSRDSGNTGLLVGGIGDSFFMGFFGEGMDIKLHEFCYQNGDL